MALVHPTVGGVRRQVQQQLSPWQPQPLLKLIEMAWRVFLTPSNLRMDLKQCQAPLYVPRGDACSLTFTCSRVHILASALSGKLIGNVTLREA